MTRDWLPHKKGRILILATLLILASFWIFITRQKPIDFNTQVKPLLNKNCITCHGGVRQQGDFSLLFRSQALANTKSGRPAIIPGDPDHSEMIRRLSLKDPEDRMPYRHDPLSSGEIAILRQWIREGAVWGDHWAYVPVKEEKVPRPGSHLFGWLPATNSAWVKNDIDYFILDALRREKLEPSAEASKATLLRRVALDLTGLPPSASLAHRFLTNQSAAAYENLVDSLLASPHYGEKWTSMWLDLARYADSRGYEKDGSRAGIWKYRDWLIRAFNEDKPYTTFLTEQLAGDLLPRPTDDQYIATGFHRNTMTNDEGGTDNEEFRTAAVLDRVNTTWQGLMGTTFSCVQCHSHPYDPFKHEDYYRFMAFFNNSRDEDSYGDYPLLREFNTGDSAKLLQLMDWVKKNGSPQEAEEQGLFLKTGQPAINSIRADRLVNSALEDTKFLTFRNHGQARFTAVDLDNKDQFSCRYSAYTGAGILVIHLDRPDGPILKEILMPKTKGWERDVMTTDLPAASGVHDLYLTYTDSRLKKPEDNGLQFDWLRFARRLPGRNLPGYAAVEKIWWELEKKELPVVPIMLENPADMHRTSNVFERGNWLVKGKVVDPDIPHSLNPFPVNAPRNRLGLAMWLTDKKNPLVSRTLVNRLWEQLFGSGLVETLEDMGTQGAAPTHKELLDWLAWKFMHQDAWSIKKCLKTMVLSATYRQDSKCTERTLKIDPYNKYYARGPRVRLSSEQIRDQALAAAGELSDKLFGPPVMPWQPAGIWLSPYSGDHWETSPGSEQYRRGIYTYWKRTAPYPSMVTFDAASREVCTARRIRTNTPLQALVTLNDSVYLDAARRLAFRMMGPGGKDPQDLVIGRGYEYLLFAPIRPSSLIVLKKLYAKAYAQLSQDPEKTCEMVGSPGPHNDPATAAYVVVANALLNLDEVITKN